VLQAVSQKFRSGCMMLARQSEGAIEFLGTAFIVHRDGYLLTAAHLVEKTDRLVVVPTVFTDDFAPITVDRVAAMSVTVAQRDADNDVALLKLEQAIGIDVPDDFLGSTAAVRTGASLMHMGYSFGYQQVHSLLVFGGVVSAKIRSLNNARLILFDTMVHPGDRGGPLVHVADSHIVGIVSGRFEADEVARGSTEWAREAPPQTNVSYAVAIEHGLELMRIEGLIPPVTTV
jgi:serine protease Do